MSLDFIFDRLQKRRWRCFTVSFLSMFTNYSVNCGMLPSWSHCHHIRIWWWDPRKIEGNLNFFETLTSILYYVTIMWIFTSTNKVLEWHIYVWCRRILDNKRPSTECWNKSHKCIKRLISLDTSVIKSLMLCKFYNLYTYSFKSLVISRYHDKAIKILTFFLKDRSSIRNIFYVVGHFTNITCNGHK